MPPKNLSFESLFKNQWAPFRVLLSFLSELQARFKTILDSLAKNRIIGLQDQNFCDNYQGIYKWEKYIIKINKYNQLVCYTEY